VLLLLTTACEPTNRGYTPAQPIAYSHAVHAGAMKVPCLYCHYGARRSRHAGIPSPSVCAGCHAMLEKQTLDLERIAESVAVDRPLVAWVKVHNLPDFVRFDHSRHVAGGIACQRCHGPVETMDRVAQVAPLTMGFCLECHRERAGVPTQPLRRALAHLDAPRAREPANLDCVGCHH
jgi:hypothetical protein